VRAPGVVLIPLSEFATRYGELPRDRPLLMICAAGSRSERAAEFLLANGFPDVANVAGGIIAWQAAGLPVTGGPPAPGEGDPPHEG
jgi:rhodanese-related sulfurtransferase